ncbi:MAG: protein kinase, partial [Pyrinomonadaceae bacterium]|nr:protein kinase [Pyrinomonadaceae bacterium]
FQTDVWALGVLFYEMLTGKYPFRAEGIMELCLKIESGEYVPVERANPSVPPEIARIVKRCLQKEKNRRYQNASELSRETARVLAEKYDLTMTDSGSFTRISSLNQTFQHEENFVQDSPPKQTNNSRIRVIWASLISVLLLFCFITIGFWAMSGEGENIVVISKGTNKDDIFVVKKSDSANNRTKPLIETSAASGDVIDVKIDVFEGSAEIVRNGENVGKTPFTLKGRTGEKVNIKLQREGCKDYETQIEFSSGKRNYTFSLQKK